ncbi:MAG TPA: penicillin-binding protein activator, partial [Hyphomicrobiaceae bacterium]|nr:penicillin-binding protein activator [Hyphomicrobiaceae bacterium]
MIYASLRFGGSQAVSRLAAACLGAALLAACSTNGPDSQTGSLNVETKSGQDRPMVKIGLLVPLSAQGQPGVIGKSLKQAAELALFERDNPNLQLIVKDDKGTPDGARAAAEDALKSGATLILGPVFAKSVAAVAPVARKAGVPVIAFSNDRQVAGNGVYLLSFQLEDEVTRLVSYAASQNIRTIALLAPANEYGRRVESALRSEAQARGVTITTSQLYNRT